MINVKPIIYAELAKLANNVSDTYPQDEETFPAILYLEEENKPFEITDNKEQKATIRYKVDIWNEASTSALALQVDELFSGLGLFRTNAQDLPEPGGLRHKMMRFEGVVDVDTLHVYQNRYE